MKALLSHTFDSILPGVLPQVPNELIGMESRARVRDIAARLPAILAGSTFGFECPLATDNPEADFLVSISGVNGAALLSETATYALQNDSAPAWSSVAELAELWADGQSIDNVWLEFDLTGETQFVPNLFFQPVYAEGNHQALREILSKIGTVLLGRMISAELETSLTRCINALPERARIFQVGAMRARSLYGLRLCVDQIYLDRILFYLEQIGYRGDLDFVRATFISLQRRTDAYALHLDLCPELDVGIGLECYLNPLHSEDHQQVRLQQLLRFLVEVGVCSKSKASAVARFPGTADVERHSAEWPVALKKIGSFLGRSSTFHRRLHHIKITFGESSRVQAKAYLAVHHRWQYKS
jgi:hypothetical protein